MHSNSSAPAARCQASLPMSELAIRKRPLTIQNDSVDTGAWVTCGFEFDSGYAAGGMATLVDAYFTNYSSTAQTLNCSGVTGYEGGENEYVGLTLELAPGATGEDANLFWYADDFEGGGMSTGLVMINCYLPPGVGINDSYVYWVEEVAPV
ncbi:hypothetical protein JG616_01010 [Luteimonas sp. MC1782]|nr:hypothetical protein [Luteimonas sp. MC1750]MBJ6977907.1 hypothetical protein [Luteimonas sp. MC1895]MBJ6984727.1 hypothetical protein [Luteimonas sp. MC1750]QQO04676.1 hypothetical protein JGR68_07135 [Luteimonas sp. MC1750]